MDATAPVDPVKRAKAAAEARIALIGTAHRRSEKIATMTAKLHEEHGLYAEEYQAALSAWSKEDLEGFGLLAPDQISTTSTRRTAKRAKPADARSDVLREPAN